MGKQDLRAPALVVVALALVAGHATAFTPPRDGGVLPDTYFHVREKDVRAYSARHGWVAKAQQLREAREARAADSAESFLRSYPLGDTLRIAVLPGYFSDEVVVPVSAAALQTQLFGANATGNITDFYHEASYGQLTVTGDVQSWAKVSRIASTYYGSCNGVDPGCSDTGTFIKEILDLRDPTVDFGLYDNDGADGVPNSGDDDGIVDAVVFVHSLVGGECGGVAASSFISHTWVYDAWPVSGGLPYTTDDPRTGGGFIQVDDYVIAPSGNCGASSPYSAAETIDIGVFCHELGHILGLPDLYDVNGGGSGVGRWSLMGSGNWNTPEKPAHFDAWCKQELGWMTPTTIGWQPTPVNIPDVETNAVSFRLPFHDERFRRANECVIADNYSLYCGYTASEAAARGYAAGGGYGPNWYQTIERDFHYSGAGAVTLQYQYRYDLEPSYDFASTVIRVNGVETHVALYTGAAAGSANIPLTSLLAPLAGAGGTYTIKFRVETDISFDDADGNDPSTCGAFAVDNVSVMGGGESYLTGFETSNDGWHINDAQTRNLEYWLVENRRKTGFDTNLLGEGLLIWHVDEEVLRAPFLGNRGGTNGALRGLVLEEAEGVFDLNGAVYNVGEPADPFPGTSNNTSFTSVSAPNSNDNLGRPTQIQATGISAAGANMTATLRAGDPGPLATNIFPVTLDNNLNGMPITVTGARIRAGATFRFVYSFTTAQTAAQAAAPAGLPTIDPYGLEWVDANTLRGSIDVYGRTPGLWHLEVTNPDGQTYTLADALTLNSVVSTRLVSAHVDVIGDAVRLRYVLMEREPGETVRLQRANGTTTDFRLLAADLEPASGDEYTYLDRDVEPGRTYSYLLESRTADGELRELHRAVATVPSRELVLDQNVPNPFNPRTSIRFYLPSRTDVRLDVYDVRGALVRSLSRGAYNSGPHAVEWDGTDNAGHQVASGFYVYRLVTNERALSRKMLLLK
jgi:M6 family metalloprotease-like protein